MEQINERWLGIALLATLYLGYFIGKLKPRIIETIIYVEPPEVTCKTCEEGVRDVL